MKRGPYKKRPPENSVSMLVQLFRQSPRYRAWGPATARRNDKLMGDFARAADAEGWTVPAIRRGDLLRARDEAFSDLPGAANHWLKAMKAIFGYAVDIEWIETNPAATIKPLPPKNRDGFATWTEDDIGQFLDHYPIGTVAHRAVTIMLYTGAARVDAVRLGWHNLKRNRIEYRRSKREKHGGPLITLPVHDDLAAVLETIPRDWGTWLQTVEGRQRSPASLTEDMRRWTEIAGLPKGRTPHGLRKAMGRRLAELGLSPHQIMSVLGHESLEMAAHYSRAYDRARAAEEAMERLSNGPAKSSVIRLSGRKKAE